MLKHLIEALLALVALVCPALALSAPVIVENAVAAPGVLTVILETSAPETGNGTTYDAIDTNPASWLVNGAHPTSVYRESTPSDEDRGVPRGVASFMVTVHHLIHLVLSQPFQEGATYQVNGPYGATSLVFGSKTTRCLALKVNQVGYSAASRTRYANLGVYLSDGGTMTLPSLPQYQVLNSSGDIVLSGTGVDMGDDTNVIPHSGEHVYRLSLNALPSGGTYRASWTGCGVSRPFGVGNAYTRQAAYTITRALYHARCGISLDAQYTQYTRAACHTQIANTKTAIDSNFSTVDYGIVVPAGTPTRRMMGGYHDAGNFQRRAQHIIIPIMLLSYYEAWPTHFVDRQYNIPESGNGIPDFLDEGMWGVLLYENLQIDDPTDPQFGGVQSGTMESPGDTYGYTSAASSSQVEGTFMVTEWVTANAVGVFAQASRLIRPYDPTHADALLARARRAWAYLQRTANVNANTTVYMYASLQLWLATREQQYHDVFKAAATAVVINGTSYPEQYLPGNAGASCQTVHFSSYLLPGANPQDQAFADSLKAKILWWANAGGYMAPPPEASPWPQGANKFLAWGALTTQGRYADLYEFATLFVTDPALKQHYIDYVSEYSDFSLGLNPLSVSFYTGMGTDNPHSPGHMDSYFTERGISDGITTDHVGKPIGPVPGILLFGPADGRSGYAYQLAVSDKMFQPWDNRPTLRRYGDGWSLLSSTEFSVWETVVWSVALFGFLYDASQDSPPPPLDAGLPPDAGVGTLDASMDAFGQVDAGAVTDVVGPVDIVSSPIDSSVTDVLGPVDTGVSDVGGPVDARDAVAADVAGDVVVTDSGVAMDASVDGRVDAGVDVTTCINLVSPIVYRVCWH